MKLTGKGILLGQEQKVSQKGNAYVIVRIAEDNGKVFEMMAKAYDTTMKQFNEVDFDCEVTQGKYPKFECLKLNLRK